MGDDQDRGFTDPSAGDLSNLSGWPRWVETAVAIAMTVGAAVTAAAIGSAAVWGTAWALSALFRLGWVD